MLAILLIQKNGFPQSICQFNENTMYDFSKSSEIVDMESTKNQLKSKKNNCSKMIALLPCRCYTICMEEKLIHARTCVYNINYYVVWSVEYRRKAIAEEMEQTMKQWAFEIGEEKGFIVHLFEAGEKDHIWTYGVCCF